MEEISWVSQGFSVRDIYWDSLSKLLLLSCGYQGVLVFELDENMNISNSWVLTTSYAYAARDYNGHVLDAMKNGIVSGYPLEDIKVTLLDGSYHDVDSSEIAFKIAGSMALRDAARKAAPTLLEPFMALEVVVPEDYLGSVMGDITSRRGNVKGMNP